MSQHRAASTLPDPLLVLPLRQRLLQLNLRTQPHQQLVPLVGLNQSRLALAQALVLRTQPLHRQPASAPPKPFQLKVVSQLRHPWSLAKVLRTLHHSYPLDLWQILEPLSPSPAS